MHTQNGHAKNGKAAAAEAPPVNRVAAASERKQAEAPPAAPPPSEPVTDGAAAPADRGTDGRFKPGNKASRGNPFARQLAARRSAFLAAVSDEDMQALARRLLDLAREGDVSAAALVLSYVVGKPGRAVDPDRLDLDEFRLLDAYPTAGEMTRAAVQGVEPAAAVLKVLAQVPRDEKSISAWRFGVKEGERPSDEAIQKVARLMEPAAERRDRRGPDQ